MEAIGPGPADEEDVLVGVVVPKPETIKVTFTGRDPGTRWPSGEEEDGVRWARSSGTGSPGWVGTASEAEFAARTRAIFGGSVIDPSSIILRMGV